MNPTKMYYDTFVFFLATLLSNFMKSCKKRLWILGTGDIVPNSLEKYKKNSKKTRNRSPAKQLKQEKKLVKPVFIFVNNNPENLRYAFVRFNSNSFVPEFIENDKYIYLNLFKKGIFMKNDCTYSQSLSDLYAILDGNNLDLDSSGNVILQIFLRY